MKSILDKTVVLKLNRNWQKIGACPVRKAFINMSDDEGPSGVCGLSLEYVLDENGWPKEPRELLNATPCSLEKWMELPIRPYDCSIQTPRGAIRVPTVVVAKNFATMPKKHAKLNKSNLWKRDKGRCGYTGRALTKKNATIDHIRPRSRGGANTWENTVLCEKKLNHSKGSSLNEEIGLKLLVKPHEPAPVPISFKIVPTEEELCRDWSFF